MAILRTLVLLLLLGTGARAEEIRVFAAASMTDVISAIAGDFEAETGRRVIVSFAGSATLARQIVQGAPADVFISANENWMNHLVEADLVAPEDRSIIATNTLVLAARAGAAPVLLQELRSRNGRIAIGDPAAVPAGRYAVDGLETLGLRDVLEPRLVPTADVRAAARLLEIGAVEFAILYATDALAFDGLAAMDSFPPESHPPIRYPAAIIARREAGRDFVAYLHGDDARRRFSDAGFGAP
ncbi:MAG: molybdate ABC transporter substrate-binding protein [Rubricella sp.]